MQDAASGYVTCLFALVGTSLLPNGFKLMNIKANAGIYRIVDLATGKIYIGSAYGSEGIWGRWRNYAKTGHEGNKLLKERDPSRFQWSIVRTVSTAMSAHDVIRMENLEKEKHGSRAIGMNEN